MKTLKIYSVIASIIIVSLSIYCYILFNELNDTNEVLNQCSERYYKEIGVSK